MKNRMMQIGMVLGLMAVTLSAQAGKLPEFMNAQQLTAWRAQHSAPPAATVAQTPDEQIQFFTGKPYDAASGTYLFMFRSYSPTLARWTSADPSGFLDGANNMRYAPNPVSEIDPLGWWKIKLVGTNKTGIDGTLNTTPPITVNVSLETKQSGLLSNYALAAKPGISGSNPISVAVDGKGSITVAWGAAVTTAYNSNGVQFTLACAAVKDGDYTQAEFTVTALSGSKTLTQKVHLDFQAVE
jgi:RHS repeat-associated protein